MSGTINTRIKGYCLLVIVLVAALLRFSSLGYSYYHIDEMIPAVVAERVIETGTLDTNWKLASLPPVFKYDQYNFSGYILSAVMALKAADLVVPSSAPAYIDLLRIYSSALGVLAVLLTFLLGRQLFNSVTGLYAAFIASVATLLYQDSLYARPETFVTVLVLFNVYLLGIGKIPLKIRMFSSALIWGLLVSTKISFFALVPISFLPAAATHQNGANSQAAQLRNYIFAGFSMVRAHFVITVIGLVFGFVVGAPYAFLNFSAYLHGVGYLNNQYTSGHWPHGLFDGSVVDRLSYSASYFSSTLGWPVILLLICGGILSLRNKHFRAFGIFLVATAFYIRFATYPVFFERNLSHLLPLSFIFAGYCFYQIVLYLRPRTVVCVAAASVLLVMSVLPTAKITYLLRFEELTGNQKARIDDAKKELTVKYDMKVENWSWVDTPARAAEKLGYPCLPRLIQFNWPNDKYSGKVLQDLQAVEGFRRVGAIPTLFPDMPPNTLHVYFSPSVFFLYRATAPSANCSASHAGL